jgi:hypothetical protein
VRSPGGPLPLACRLTHSSGRGPHLRPPPSPGAHAATAAAAPAPSACRPPGFPTWDAMWEFIKADPVPWTTYLNRVLYFMVSTTYLPGAMVPEGGVQVDTMSPAVYNSAGKAAGYAPLVVETVGYKQKGTVPKIVLYAAEYQDTNATAPPASAPAAVRGARAGADTWGWRRKNKKKHRVNVVMVDLLNMFDIGKGARASAWVRMARTPAARPAGGAAAP